MILLFQNGVILILYSCMWTLYAFRNRGKMTVTRAPIVTYSWPEILFSYFSWSEPTVLCSLLSLWKQEHVWKLEGFHLAVWYWHAAVLCIWAQEWRSRRKWRSQHVISDVEVVWKSRVGILLSSCLFCCSCSEDSGALVGTFFLFCLEMHSIWIVTAIVTVPPLMVSEIVFALCCLFKSRSACLK